MSDWNIWDTPHRLNKRITIQEIMGTGIASVLCESIYPRFTSTIIEVSALLRKDEDEGAGVSLVLLLFAACQI